jgi:DNA polymerase-3 subunit alpha
MVKFAGHAHCHDEYSLLDGSANRNQLSYEAVRKGQDYLAITNHGRLGGVLEHVHACRHPEKYENPLDPSVMRAGTERLVPTLGIEAYYRPDRFMDLSDESRYGKNGHNWAQHLCIHAGSLQGWRTLLRLSAKSWVKKEFGGGFYGKPVIDLDMLENDHEGLIFSTACISSPLAFYIMGGDERGAKRWVRQMQQFGPVWLEIMPHNFDFQRQYNIGVVNVAHDLGEPLIATQDVHTPYQHWMQTQSIVRMISYRQTISKKESKQASGEDTYTEEIDSVYLTSAEEMAQQFTDNHPDLPTAVVREAMANTHDFFGSFRPFTFGKSLKMPHVDLDVNKVVWEWVQEGLTRIKDSYPAQHWKRYPYEEYERRVKEEWDVLVNKDVIAYFYIVGDFVRWAKSSKPLPIRIGSRVIYPKGKRKKPIRVGLGRGSAAGCIISYLIGITQIDPIPHELLFERFLNPDREGMPDIDTDFEGGEYGRDLVKEYLRVVYGYNRVADVIAYQTFGPRAVIREVSNTQDADFKEIKEVCDSIGDTERGLEKIAANNPLVGKFKGNHPEWWQHMLNLEDQIKNDSRHARAIIITDEPVVDTGMALQTGSDGRSIITAWADRIEFPIVSMYGWQKFDLLGITSLNKIQAAVDLIERYYGETVEPNELSPLRDPRDVEGPVMDAFIEGKTWDVFQLSGRGMTDAMRAVSPVDTIEIALVNALYRPGASAQIDEFVQRKRGKSKWKLWHDSLEPYLGYTYGIIAFQEQVMQVCKAMGNFTGAQADFMRKAISKLYRLGKEEAQKEMAPFWEIWEAGCRKNGIPDKLIREVWQIILNFGGYSFNRSHSASYGLQAYQDMWLKVHYPLAFYAAALTVGTKGDKKEQEQFLKSGLREARTFGVEALPPDVNASEAGWIVDDGNLRFGLASINEMGWAAAQGIMANRPYMSFTDYCQRNPEGTNKTHAIALVKAGAFDSTDDREYLLSQAGQWEGLMLKFQVQMACGCSRPKTVKLSEKQVQMLQRRKVDIDVAQELRAKAEETLALMHCVKHKDKYAESWEERHDTYTVAEFIREKGVNPTNEVVPPTPADIAMFERESLNIGMTSGSPVVRYYDFIEERIMTMAEVDEIPQAPKRRKVKGSWLHGSNCDCEECEAANVTVGGEVTRTSVITTKGGDKMAFVDMAFGSDVYTLTFFPHTYRRDHKYLREPTAFLVRGRKNDRGAITVNDIFDVIEVAADHGWEPPPLNTGKRNGNGGVKFNRKMRALAR